MGILEASISAILISLLIVVFFTKVLSISVAMERESMQLTVNQLGSALNIEALTLIIKEDQEGLARWVGANPMKLLDPKPLHYKGSFTDPDAMTISPGSWFFNESNGLLIYRINHIEQFGGGRAVPEHVRFRVETEYEDKNGNRLRDIGERITGLRFNALDEYYWQSEVAGTEN
jgi:hypothetical protein